MIIFAEVLTDRDVSWPTVGLTLIAALPSIISSIAALIVAVRNSKKIGRVEASVNGLVDQAITARVDAARIRAIAESSGVNLGAQGAGSKSGEPVSNPRTAQDSGRGNAAN